MAGSHSNIYPKLEGRDMAVTVNIDGQYLTTDGTVFRFAGWEPTGFEGAVQHLEHRGYSRSWAWEHINDARISARREQERSAHFQRNFA